MNRVENFTVDCPPPQSAEGKGKDLQSRIWKESSTREWKMRGKHRYLLIPFCIEVRSFPIKRPSVFRHCSSVAARESNLNPNRQITSIYFQVVLAPPSPDPCRLPLHSIFYFKKEKVGLSNRVVYKPNQTDRSDLVEPESEHEKEIIQTGRAWAYITSHRGMWNVECGLDFKSLTTNRSNRCDCFIPNCLEKSMMYDVSAMRGTCRCNWEIRSDELAVIWIMALKRSQFSNVKRVNLSLK
ncbi:hypothetical protein H6P81_008661 [Aristolochia fimbriata]|uniref:Uncharacterized protein n=1 Tax=Aristolochia fimbriata TaxID=158543 RepID=A0AAV7ELZ8_ARIFI|nr:hypothetical protein H6P81_008661 [Aristolochia fimbriata]